MATFSIPLGIIALLRNFSMAMIRNFSMANRLRYLLNTIFEFKSVEPEFRSAKYGKVATQFGMPARPAQFVGMLTILPRFVIAMISAQFVTAISETLFPSPLRRSLQRNSVWPRCQFYSVPSRNYLISL